jgi:hypothetical protein
MLEIMKRRVEPSVRILEELARSKTKEETSNNSSRERYIGALTFSELVPTPIFKGG